MASQASADADASQLDYETFRPYCDTCSDMERAAIRGSINPMTQFEAYTAFWTPTDTQICTCESTSECTGTCPAGQAVEALIYAYLLDMVLEPDVLEPNRRQRANPDSFSRTVHLNPTRATLVESHIKTIALLRAIAAAQHPTTLNAKFKHFVDILYTNTIGHSNMMPSLSTNTDHRFIFTTPDATILMSTFAFWMQHNPNSNYQTPNPFQCPIHTVLAYMMVGNELPNDTSIINYLAHLVPDRPAPNRLTHLFNLLIVKAFLVWWRTDFPYTQPRGNLPQISDNPNNFRAIIIYHAATLVLLEPTNGYAWEFLYKYSYFPEIPQWIVNHVRPLGTVYNTDTRINENAAKYSKATYIRSLWRKAGLIDVEPRYASQAQINAFTLLLPKYWRNKLGLSNTFSDILIHILERMPMQPSVYELDDQSQHDIAMFLIRLQRLEQAGRTPPTSNDLITDTIESTITSRRLPYTLGTPRYG